MNRQPRPPRQARGGRQNGGNTRTTQHFNVPTTSQVVPGAGVSIILKQDQHTGREVQGVVKDLLTRGDHPRGIKVRLVDGRIGRVQRMIGDVQSAAEGDVLVHHPSPQASHSRLRNHNRQQDSGNADGPPPRTLADFLPPETPQEPPSPVSEGGSKTVKCPFCDAFEGDELAVSHHIEEHMT